MKTKIKKMKTIWNGKIPPQAVELEKRILGAIMVEKDIIEDAAFIISADSFYNENHKIIYEACLELSRELLPIDLLTVTEQLRKTNKIEEIGGVNYLTELTSSVDSASNIEYHCRIIKDKESKRNLITVANEAQKQSFDDFIDVQDTIDMIERSVYELNNNSIKNEPVNSKNVIDEIYQNLGEDKGKKIAFKEMPVIAGGDLVIIAGRPSMGKTAFCLNLLMTMKSAAFFSLEMSTRQLLIRQISAKSKVDYFLVREGRLTDDEIPEVELALKLIKQSDWYIDDTPGITTMELRRKARRLAKKGIEAIFVDYLQLMSGSGDNRENEISKISRELKGIAKELNIPVIALSQLSRKLESRSDKRPMLSDLRESGAIEQDADIVMFIYRDSYYTKDHEDKTIEIIVGKHRNGGLYTFNLNFNRNIQRFEERGKNNLSF